MAAAAAAIANAFFDATGMRMEEYNRADEGISRRCGGEFGRIRRDSAALKAALRWPTLRWPTSL